LTFVDNAVDASTDTIRLKATFANQQRQLWPGQVVEVTLRLSEEQNAVVVLRRPYRTVSRASLFLS
jgi:multidrug efflux system membrane fusion protein